MQDENYIAPAMAVNATTGLLTPIKCDSSGNVLVVYADDGSVDLPSVEPIKDQDDNYVPMSQGVNNSGLVAPINASYSGILKVISV